MLRIWLLGQFDVQVEGKRTVIPARAAQSLLAFLVLTAGTAHRREKLAGMLWPDMSDEGARHNLRHELWRLRKALGANQTNVTEYILAEDLSIQFNPHAEYWLDAAQLERAAAPDDSVGDLIGRVSLYRGELLPGFYDDWVGPERDRVQAIFEHRMDGLIRLLIDQERWQTVIEWSERWIGLGHTPEAAYRALMLAHSTLGETSKVALDYERCAEELRADLDIEPSPETRALYEKLTHGETLSPEQLGTTPTVFVHASGTVTFLFSDIEGSTKLLERLGDEYARLLADHADLLREIGEKHNGHEIDTQGDSFFFAFFRAADAVAFAADAQRALAEHPWPQASNLGVRMGLHTGEPMLARTGYVGMDVHRAARIGAAGHGGQVLLSPTTRALVEADLPGGTGLRDLGEHKLKDLRYPVHIVQLTIDGLPSDFPPLKSINTGNEPPAPGEPPFKGLEFFDEADASLFFGREPLVAKLVNEILEQRFVAVVVGASGSGKSSVVRAGLIPALRTAQSEHKREYGAWQVYVMTPTAHPLEALATVLTREHVSLTATAALLDDLAREPRSLHLFLTRILLPDLMQDGAQTRPGRILILIDQFEELFTLCRDDLEREQFIDNLVAALGPGKNGQSNITLVLTIRADFYAHLAEYPELRDLVAKQQEYIGPMNSDELRRAIEEPAKRGGWEFEPGLVDLILRDVGDEPGALPLLSHALLETWKRRSAHRMTLQGYHDAGGVRGAIALTAETTFELLSTEEKLIAQSIFLRLTELGEGTEDTRRRAEISELETGEWDSTQVRQVLTGLADARLITTSDHSVEVAHEALIREWPRLREWLNEDRDGLKLHRALTEAAHEWELMERDPSVLYRGARLAQASEFATSHQNVLNATERAFLAASVENAKREEQEREEQRERELLAAQKLAAEQQARAEEQSKSNQRLRQRAVFLVGALVLALLLAGIALWLGDSANRNALVAAENAAHAQSNADTAEKEKRAATARELAAAAVSSLEADPERSILLALQAVDTTKSTDGAVLPEAEEALHRAIQLSRVINTFTVPSKAREVAYSPDGTRLAVRANGLIRIWDLLSNKEILSIALTPDWSDRIAFSADGKRIAAMDAVNETNIGMKIFDAQTGAMIKSLTLPIPLNEWYYSVLSPDWSQVAVGQSGGTASVWDMETGQKVLTLSGQSDGVSDIVYSPDGKRIATGETGGVARVWDAETGKQLVTLNGHSEAILSITFSPDGKKIATGSQDHTAILWDATTGQEIDKFTFGGWVQRVRFDPDGKRMATLALSSQATIWDIETGQELVRLSGHSGSGEALAFDPTGTRLATVSGDGTIKIWNLEPMDEAVTVQTTGPVGGPIYLGNIVFSPDGSQMAVGLKDGTIKVWNAATGEQVFTLLGHTDDVRVAFSPDGRWIGSASTDTTAMIWDTKTGQEHLTFRGHNSPVGMIAFHPDGERVATASEHETIKIWNLKTGQELHSFPVQPLIYGLAFSPDGTRLAASGGNGSVMMLDTESGRELFKKQIVQGQGVFNIVFNSDGSRIVLSGYTPPGAVVLDSTTGEQLLIVGGIPTVTDWIDLTRDGTRLASAHVGRKLVKIWDAATGKELLTLSEFQAPPQAVAFAPDGKRLAVVTDKEVLVYLLQIEDLVALAKTRVTRTLTQEECQKYLHVEKCP